MLILIAGGESGERARRRRAHAQGTFEELDVAISVEEIAGLAGTPTLLGGRHAFFLRNVTSAKSEAGEAEYGSLRDELPALASGLVASPHLFVLDEEKVPTKALVERLRKAGAEVEFLETPPKKEALNIFELAGALEKRDRKALWLGLMKTRRADLSPEQVAGVLAWKARTLLAGARTPEERASRRRLSRSLVSMYHDAHRGAGDLGLLLEHFALTL